MLRALTLALALLPAAVHAGSRPETGLLAKPSPLPATIPLQVRTVQGHDYAISLTDTDGAPVIQGYQRGGSFFRLLVPPGRHDVTITAGRAEDWQAGQGFADGMKITLPLDFAIRGERRQGHQIAVKVENGSLSVTNLRDQTICQIAEWDSTLQQQTTPAGTPLRHLDQSLSTRSRFCD